MPCLDDRLQRILELQKKLKAVRKENRKLRKVISGRATLEKDLEWLDKVKAAMKKAGLRE